MESIKEQLNELRGMEPGWLDGEGKTISDETINRTIKIFESFYPEDLLITPYIYPTEEGGIQIEWNLMPFAPSLEIFPDSDKASWHSIQFIGKEPLSYYADIILSSKEHLEWVKAQIWHMHQGCIKNKNEKSL